MMLLAAAGCLLKMKLKMAKVRAKMARMRVKMANMRAKMARINPKMAEMKPQRASGSYPGGTSLPMTFVELWGCSGKPVCRRQDDQRRAPGRGRKWHTYATFALPAKNQENGRKNKECTDMRA